MIKSWLITTSAPFCGTEQHYCAFSESPPTEIQELNDWFWEEETIHLWDLYSFYNDDQYEEEFNDYPEEDWEEFMEQKLQEWKEQCNFSTLEMDIEELKNYTVGGEDLPEIIYDERK